MIYSEFRAALHTKDPTSILNAIQNMMPGMDEKDSDGKTAIMYAAEAHSFVAVAALIKAGADVNIADGTGKTALMESVMWSAKSVDKRTKIAEALLAVPGIDVNATNQHGSTALIEAVRIGTMTLRMAGEQGTLVKLKAARNGTIAIIRTLLAHGANINATDQYGRTALIEVVRLSNTFGVEKARRDNPPQLNPAFSVSLPLPEEVSIGLATIVNALLAAPGIDVNAADKSGTTALLMAASMDNTAVVEALFAAGADVNAVDKDGKTAFDYAKRIIVDGGEPEGMIECLTSLQSSMGVTTTEEAVSSKEAEETTTVAVARLKPTTVSTSPAPSPTPQQGNTTSTEDHSVTGGAGGGAGGGASGSASFKVRLDHSRSGQGSTRGV